MSTLTNFPNGIASFGVPQIGGGGVIPATTGSYYFVHSGTGSNGNDGKSPTYALATIDYAVGLATADAGDVIIVMPGHAENISAATSLVVDKAGVQIIGLGHGNNRPVLTFTNTAGSIEMDAANTRLSNMVLLASVSAVVVGINVDADGVTLDNLEFQYDATGDDFVTMIDVDAFDRCAIENCRLIAESGAAGAEQAIRLDDCHFVRIVGNWFSGQWSDSVIVGEGAAGTDLLLASNFMYNADTGDANGIDLNVAFTGLIMNNRVGTLYAVAVANLLDPGSCLCAENYCVNAIDETGIVEPATPSA
jgi:hypothetical protein